MELINKFNIFYNMSSYCVIFITQNNTLGYFITIVVGYTRVSVWILVSAWFE